MCVCIHVCACMCVYEVSEFILYKLKVRMNILSFYLLKKKKRKKSHVPQDEIFFKVYILYECNELLNLVQNLET